MFNLTSQKSKDIIIISSDSEDAMSDTENRTGETMEYSYNNSEYSMESDSKHTDSDISILGSDDYMSETEDEASDVPITDLEPEYNSYTESDYEPTMSDSYLSESESEEIFDTNIITEKELNNLSHNPNWVPKNRKRISKQTKRFDEIKFVSGSKDKTDYQYDAYKRNRGPVENLSKNSHNKSSKR